MTHLRFVLRSSQNVFDQGRGKPCKHAASFAECSIKVSDVTCLLASESHRRGHLERDRTGGVGGVNGFTGCVRYLVMRPRRIGGKACPIRDEILLNGRYNGTGIMDLNGDESIKMMDAR